MNLREQFEKETGEPWSYDGYLATKSYIEWLEQRNKDQVEVLEKELSFLNSIEGFFSKDFEVKLQYRIRSIKEQIKKSGEL